ncbi:IS30 family transposase [Fundicoccus sp. Sow4_D5]|uniref:IS30 family transposase n=1 Tax=Fundicoccus sp. Sow4_D5 TaxID=3438782 RepID=UPI003F924655
MVKNYKITVVKFSERVSKLIIALETPGRIAKDIEETLNNWLNQLTKNLFKSITVYCGKEFSNCKSLSNQQYISIFFANPGCPSQYGLIEHLNSLLRKAGLPKQIDFNEVIHEFISSVTLSRNKIPRKSLNYKTLLDIFIENTPELVNL